MRRTEKQKKSRRRWTYRLIAIAVMVAAMVGLLSQTVFAQNSYVITDGENVTVYKTFSTDPKTVLNEAGIELSEEDTYTTTYTDGGFCIDIQRVQEVTVINQGNRSVISTYGESVNELLDRMNIVLGENDELSCNADMQTYDGMTVRIVHKDTQILQYEEKIPYQTKFYEDPELAPGEEIVLVEGVDGVSRFNAEVVYENGVEVSRQIVDKSVVAESVTRLVVRGPSRAAVSQPGESKRAIIGDEASAPATSREDVVESAENTPAPTAVETTPTEAPTAPSKPTAEGNTLTTTSGMTYTYTDALTVSCTAYSCGGNVGYTYSGTLARVGAVAVDPNYIPLGTRMYIVSNDGQYVYGYCVAEDIGGGIKGYKIDLYFDTIAECYQFGVRTCTAYILQ